MRLKLHKFYLFTYPYMEGFFIVFKPVWYSEYQDDVTTKRDSCRIETLVGNIYSTTRGGPYITVDSDMDLHSIEISDTRAKLYKAIYAP